MNGNRYSDEKLNEFGFLIDQKIKETESLLLELKGATKNPNGTSDTDWKNEPLERGSETESLEKNEKLIARQERFLNDLYLAKRRVYLKTFGICRVTGKLILEERLRGNLVTSIGCLEKKR